MNINLEAPNPAMEPQQVDDVNLNNIKKLRQAINQTGAQELLKVEINADSNFTSGSYVVVAGMEGALATSGGFIMIDFLSTVEIPGGQLMFLELVLDGNVVTLAKIGSVALNTPVKLEWRGKLSAGKHTVSLRASVSGGTFVFSKSNTTTRLQVIEIVL